MNVLAYVRVSTDQQADSGESLGVQERTVKGYAMMKGVAEPTLYIERAVSGSIPFGERPEGAKLLATVQPGDMVIATAIDRAFRSALDALSVLGEFKARGIGLHIVNLGGDVTEDGSAKLVFSILAAVAEGERDRLRERVRDVKRDQKSRGRYLGGAIPWGYKLDAAGGLVALDELPALVERMRFERAQGASLRRVADIITESGYPISFVQVRSLTM